MTADATMIGTKVTRVHAKRGWGHGETGVVVEETDNRIRVKWDSTVRGAVRYPPRRTWLARESEGSRWALADSAQGRDAIAWAADAAVKFEAFKAARARRGDR